MSYYGHNAQILDALASLKAAGHNVHWEAGDEQSDAAIWLTDDRCLQVTHEGFIPCYYTGEGDEFGVTHGDCFIDAVKAAEVASTMKEEV